MAPMPAASGPATIHTATMTEALFEAYWRDGLNISELEVLQKLLDEHDLDGRALLEAVSCPDRKVRLRSNSDYALQCGVFSAPSFLGADTLLGEQDRLNEALIFTGGQADD